MLWPARIGAFSLVMGRHTTHPDTSSLPFSYLIESKGVTYLVPGVNLRSVGTIRDVQKWPKRDRRPEEGRLDRMLYDDANKEFSLSAKTGFGFDGLGATTEADFESVRGVFERNPFVAATTEHMARKDKLGILWIDRLNRLSDRTT